VVPGRLGATEAGPAAAGVADMAGSLADGLMFMADDAEGGGAGA